MVVANFKQGDKHKTVHGLWQWDHGKVLQIVGLDLPVGTEAHFATLYTGKALVMEPAIVDENTVEVKIPNQVLVGKDDAKPQSYDIIVYLYVEDDVSGTTKYTVRLPVKGRPKPEDYVYTETEVYNYKALEKKIYYKPLPVASTQVSSNGKYVVCKVNMDEMEHRVRYFARKDEDISAQVQFFINCDDGTSKIVAVYADTDEASFLVEKNGSTWYLGKTDSNECCVIDVSDRSTANKITVAHEYNRQWLSTNNTVEYIPTKPYHPATKQYVDDSVDTVLEKLEIFGSESDVFIITVIANTSESGNTTYTADRTFEEIIAAINDNKDVFAYMASSTEMDSDKIKFMYQKTATSAGNGIFIYFAHIDAELYAKTLTFWYNTTSNKTTIFYKSRDNIADPFMPGLVRVKGLFNSDEYPIPVTLDSEGYIEVRATPAISDTTNVKEGYFLSVKTIGEGTNGQKAVTEIEAVEVKIPQLSELQADWLENDSIQPTYVKNKPDIMDKEIVPNILEEFSTLQNFVDTIRGIPKKIFITAKRNKTLALTSNVDTVKIICVQQNGEEKVLSPTNTKAVSNGKAALYKYSIVFRAVDIGDVGTVCTFTLYGEDSSGNRSIGYTVDIEIISDDTYIESKSDTLIAKQDFVYVTKKLYSEIKKINSTKLTSPTTANIGQTIVVKTVDENGKPTEWECINVPTKLSQLQNDLYYTDNLNTTNKDIIGAINELNTLIINLKSEILTKN